MRQGAIKSSFDIRGYDLYETPECATRALIENENLPDYIWEPCAGRGAISRILIESGYDVHTSDLVAYDNADCGIITPVDFFEETKPPFIGDFAIVTNPPYKCADQFIRHALTLCPKVIVLLRLMYQEGDKKSDIIDNYLSHIWLGRERLPMMHREGYEGSKLSKAAMPFAWFVFNRHYKKDGFVTRRISWKVNDAA